MGILSLPRVKQNQAITGETLINSPATTLESVVNGNLEDSNMGSNSPVKIVNTLSGETTRKGKTVLLQAGSSRIFLVYDDTIGKWLSNPVLCLDQHESDTTTGTTFANITRSKFPAVMIPDFKAIYDAGLRPEFQLWALLTSGTNPIEFRASVHEWNVNDTSYGSSIIQSQTLSWNTSTPTFKLSDWAAATIGSAPVETHGAVQGQIRLSTAGGTGTCAEAHIEMRYKSV